MITIAEIIGLLEKTAPPVLQEHYDNAGLITGNAGWVCTGALCSLDATEQVVDEAIQKNCNLIVAHHPIIFGGLKKITGKNYVEKTIIKAIKNDIAIYAIHTNLDNVIQGVNGIIANKLSLKNCQTLLPKENTLKKLYTFVPVNHVEKLRSAIFLAGGGNIGNYSECSFSVLGEGSFKAGSNAQPFVGQVGQRHYEQELKIEIIFPNWMEKNILDTLLNNHPYEEVAYDIISLNNTFQQVGSGLIGDLENEFEPDEFLSFIKNTFELSVIKHTSFLNIKIKRVAVCGGAGSFLISKAITSGADIFITGDVKYHEFFDANDKIIITDIGHYESEQFTKDLLVDILKQKFPTFAVLKSESKTNPINYFI